jgi:hypothetical protein
MIIAAMYFRRVGIDGRSYAAAPTCAGFNRCYVVKHVDAAEVRIVVAAVLAAAADAVLVAHHLPKLDAHLITARPFEEVA